MNQTSIGDEAPELEGAEVRLSVVEMVNIVLRHWRMVVGLPAAVALVVILWTVSQDRTYRATASLMPQATETGRAGGAAALAQQFGVNLGSEPAGQSPDFYVDLLRRRTLLRQVVETEYELPLEGGIRRGNLIEWYDVGEGGMLPAWRQAVEMLRGDMSTSVGRQTPVVELAVSAFHPSLAEQVAKRILVLLHEFNVEIRQSRALEEGRFVASRIREVQSELQAAERELQQFLSHNRQFQNSPELMFEHDRLQRQVAMRQEIYTSLLRSQEQAQIDAARDTPMFMVIDQPEAEPEGRGLVLRTVLALVLGLMLALLIALLSEFGRRVRQADDPHYREFKRLVRQARRDFFHPRRWLRSAE